MKIRDIHLKHSPAGPPFYTAEELASLIDDKLTADENKAFSRVSDRCKQPGLGPQGCEELALRLRAVFEAAGEELRLPPVGWKSSRRRENPGTRPLRELVSEEL
jgi:hypothetical protein